MIYKIFDQDANTLLEKPESGMGYQIIQAHQYCQNVPRKFVVYNTNLAVELNADFQINKRRILNEGYKKMLDKSPELMLETGSIKILGAPYLGEVRDLSYIKEYYYNRQSGGGAAIDNPEEKPDGLEIIYQDLCF